MILAMVVLSHPLVWVVVPSIWRTLTYLYRLCTFDFLRLLPFPKRCLLQQGSCLNFFMGIRSLPWLSHSFPTCTMFFFRRIHLLQGAYVRFNGVHRDFILRIRSNSFACSLFLVHVCFSSSLCFIFYDLSVFFWVQVLLLVHACASFCTISSSYVFFFFLDGACVCKAARALSNCNVTIKKSTEMFQICMSHSKKKQSFSSIVTHACFSYTTRQKNNFCVIKTKF
jgi:hypothetical protein